MWSPTHVQVTVMRARNLLVKGKNGTNNPFVTIGVGKEKYQTSVKEKEKSDIVLWQEQCELTIPKIGNTASIVLTALHKNSLNMDEFLGTVNIPLSTLDVYERPKSRWFKLEGKPGKEKGKDKERGELEVRIAFTVKAATGSLMDLSKKEKHKSSMDHLSSMAGSLLSLSDKRGGIRQIAKSISKKVGRKKRDSNGGDGASEKGSLESMDHSSHNPHKGGLANVDPGVISEDEDEFTFDNLSHKSSGSSINVNNPALENLAGGEFLRRSTKGPPAKPPRVLSPPPGAEKLDEWEQKLFGKGDTLKRSSYESAKNAMLDSAKASPEPAPAPAIVFSTVPSILSDSERSPSLGKSRTLDDVRSDGAAPAPKPPTPVLIASKPPAVVTPSPKPAERKLLSTPNLTKETPEPEPKESKFAKKLKQLQPYKKEKKEETKMDRFIVGEESGASPGLEASSRHDKDVLSRFQRRSRDDLIDMVLHSERQLKELEDYLDQLLLRVMETTPKILQNPYITCKTQANLKFN